MTSQTVPVPKTTAPYAAGSDRRLQRRYFVGLDIECREIASGSLRLCGTTVDLSGNGISFTVPAALRVGTEVEVAVDWPVNLNSCCGLKMVAVGTVVRRESGVTAIRLDSYRFRPVRTGAKVAPSGE